MIDERGLKRNNSSLGPLIGLIFIFVIVGAWKTGMFNIAFTSHAINSHMSDISQIDNCFKGSGKLSSIFQTSNGRWSQYCNDGGKNNYWRIYDCNQYGERIVVTQFKQGVRKLKNYLFNHQMIEGQMPC